MAEEREEEEKIEGAEGVAQEFDFAKFAEENKIEIPEEELEQEFSDQEAEEEEEAEEPEPKKSSKQKVNECKMFVEFIDMGMSFVLTMTAGDPPNEREKYCADEGYKQQMAEQMALCEWTPKLKPEYMLVFIALLAYGPHMVTAWKKRSARERIKKDKEKKGEKVAPIIHMVEDPKTGEWVEVREDEFESAKSSPKEEPEIIIEGKSKTLKTCGVCGKPHNNKEYCSKKCNLEAQRSKQAKAKREEASKDVEM